MVIAAVSGVHSPTLDLGMSIYSLLLQKAAVEAAAAGDEAWRRSMEHNEHELQMAAVDRGLGCRLIVMQRCVICRAMIVFYMDRNTY